MQTDAGTSRKCPVCGVGDLVDVTFREDSTAPDGEPIQQPESRQVETYSCGHEVPGPRLDRTASGTQDLDVERRSSEDATDPPLQD